MSLPVGRAKDFFGWIGDVGAFGLRAIQRSVGKPFGIEETVRQIYEAGWRSLPLVAACGFAFGAILGLQT